jgi:addiction module HigA family antidote
MTSKRNPLAPVHPGEILREEFLEPLDLTPYVLAAELHVPRTRIERLIREETAMTPDTALRLARYFSTLPPSSPARLPDGGAVAARDALDRWRHIEFAIRCPNTAGRARR